MDQQVQFCKAMRVKPKNFDESKHLDKVATIQKKEDGHRVMVVSDDNCHLKFIGRLDDHRGRMQGHPLLRHFQDFMPPRTVVDGEMHVAGGTSSDVLTAMIQNDKRLQFTAFQVMMLDGEMKTGVTDLQEMEDLIDELNLEGPEAIPLDSAYHIMNLIGGYANLTDYLLDRATREEIEGYVLKGSANGRDNDWFKLKPVKTVDLIVMSYSIGKGKHEGKLGALQGGVIHGRDVIEVASVGTGYSDEQRLWQPTECVGRVMEVSYQSVGPKGKLIFPRFERFRDNEKQVNECTMDQLK